MRLISIILFIASLYACALLPQEERYVTDQSINDNVTASNDQQLAYWRSYGF